MLSKLRIAQIKMVPENGALESNHQRMMTALSSIADERPDVVITPEGYLDGYIATEERVSADDLKTYAIDPASSPFARDVSGWAKANNSWFIFGCARIAPEGVFNSALIYDRAGKLSGIYDKLHIQTHDVKYVPGKKLPVFNSEFGPFGVMICADRRWPETVRTLALKGARVIFNPTYGMHDDFNLRIMSVRAYESEIFIAFTHPRQALVVGPRGEVLRNETSDGVVFAVTEIDLKTVDEVRSGAAAHLRDRRADVYMA